MAELLVVVVVVVVVIVVVSQGCQFPPDVVYEF